MNKQNIEQTSNQKYTQQKPKKLGAFKALSCKLYVHEKNYISPNYLSITFKCDAIEQYKHAQLGNNNKIFVPPLGDKTVNIPILDLTTFKWNHPDPTRPATIRTYTHRAIDLVQKTLTIDFAVHPGESIACAWAVNAVVGDELGMVMRAEAHQVLPSVDHYLFITDPTGIPVTAAFIESLPNTAAVHIIAEVPSTADHYPFQTEAQLTIEWLYNPHPEQGSALIEALKTHPVTNYPANNRYAHITAEFTTVRSARDFLRKHNGWQRQECYACSYWKIGKKENETPPGENLMDD